MDRPLPRVRQQDDQPGFAARRSPRIALEQPVMLRTEAGGQVEAVLCDLSARGFMARCAEPIPIGSYVALYVEGVGPQQAQVRWWLAGRLGARFIDLVSVHRCRWVQEHAAG